MPWNLSSVFLSFQNLLLRPSFWRVITFYFNQFLECFQTSVEDGYWIQLISTTLMWVLGLTPPGSMLNPLPSGLRGPNWDQWVVWPSWWEKVQRKWSSIKKKKKREKRERELRLKCRKDKSAPKTRRQRGAWCKGRVKESDCWEEEGMGTRYTKH